MYFYSRRLFSFFYIFITISLFAGCKTPKTNQSASILNDANSISLPSKTSSQLLKEMGRRVDIARKANKTP
jgi:hypothetical protein